MNKLRARAHEIRTTPLCLAFALPTANIPHYPLIKIRAQANTDINQPNGHLITGLAQQQQQQQQ